MQSAKDDSSSLRRFNPGSHQQDEMLQRVTLNRGWTS